MQFPRLVSKVPVGALALMLGAGTLLSACDTGDSATAARFVPADAEGFVTVSIDPTVGQKAKLLALSKRLPDTVQADKADDARNKMISELVKDNGLDFNTDVKPWLGGEAAGALLKPYDGGKEPLPVALLRVKDEKAAHATLDKRKVPASSYRFLKGYVVLVEDKNVRDHQGGKALDAVEALTKSGDSLQDAPRYKSALKTLSAEHLALGWFDVPAIMDTAKLDDRMKSELGSNDGAVKDLIEGIRGAGSWSFDVHATTTSVVLRTATEHPTKWAPKSTNGDLIKHLPAETLGAIEVPEVDKVVKSALDGIQKSQAATPSDSNSTPGDPSSSSFGGNLLTDPVVTNFLQSIAGEAVVAVGKADKTQDLPVGFVATTKDAKSAQNALDAVAAKVRTEIGLAPATVTVTGGKAYEFSLGGDTGGGGSAAASFSAVGTPLTAVSMNSSDYLANPYAESSTVKQTGPDARVIIGIVNNKLIISNKIDYFNKLAQSENPGLGGSANYTELFGDLASEPLGSQVYVDVQGVIKLAQSDAGTGKPSMDEQKWLDHMHLFGAQSWTDGKHEYGELRLSFK